MTRICPSETTCQFRVSAQSGALTSVAAAMIASALRADRRRGMASPLRWAGPSESAVSGGKDVGVVGLPLDPPVRVDVVGAVQKDRKSTRLNSSHTDISRM